MAAWHIVLFSDRIAALAATLEGADRTSAHSSHDIPARLQHDIPARLQHDIPARLQHDIPAHLQHDIPAHLQHDTSARSQHDTSEHLQRDDFINALLTDLAEAQAGPPARLTNVTAATTTATAWSTDTDSIIEIHADRLRSPVELGLGTWWISL